MRAAILSFIVVGVILANQRGSAQTTPAKKPRETAFRGTVGGAVAGLGHRLRDEPFDGPAWPVKVVGKVVEKGVLESEDNADIAVTIRRRSPRSTTIKWVLDDGTELSDRASRRILALDDSLADTAKPTVLTGGKKDDSRDEEIKPIVIYDKLSDEDPRDAVKVDCAHKVHVVKLLAGRTYQIDMIKKDSKRSMDPYLRIEDAKLNKLAEDDDSGGDLNARILFTPPHDDDYRIIATALFGTGEYTLNIKVVPKVPVVKGLLRFDDTLAVTDLKDEARPGCFCKIYTVKLIKGKTYTIDMVSGAVDSYLRIEDSKKTRLAQDDDSGGYPNARIVFVPPETGEYRLIGTTFIPNTVGPFSITVRGGE